MPRLPHKTIADDLMFLAKVNGWQLMWHKEEFAELYFRKAGCGLTVWYSKMTVRTALDHPTMGKTQMYRKRVDMLLMESLFSDPRTHTNKGYIAKDPVNKKRWRRTNKTDVVVLGSKIKIQRKKLLT